MNFYKLILIILVVFLQTGNVLSNNNRFDVNNIEIEKKGKTSSEVIANQAIKKGFYELLNKILLEKDREKLKDLQFFEIKELVTYYRVSNKIVNDINKTKINYNISFDKDKIHNLFFKKNISYSEITNKELFILPIFKKNNQIFIYNQNFFYDNWNNIYNTELVEFILPLENIEIFQNINSNIDNLLNLNLDEIFLEYSDKNLALILIEINNQKEEKVYFKAKILDKSILKKISIQRLNLNEEEFYRKIIVKTKQEIINLVKLQNLIDIRIPSFLNTEFEISEKNNLSELTSRLKEIDLIEKIYIQEFNNKKIFLKIKYLGKLDKMIKLFKSKKINLKLIGDKWRIEII